MSQWRTLRQRALDRAEAEARCSLPQAPLRPSNLPTLTRLANQTVVDFPDGGFYIESDPSFFADELRDAPQQPFNTRRNFADEMRRESQFGIGFGSAPNSSDCIGLGDCAPYTLKDAPAESALGARAFYAMMNAKRPAGVKVTDQFSGRCAVTEFFSNRVAYADPQQFDNTTGCPQPTREDLYVVRFINSAQDENGISTRTPLIFEVDQQSGLLAPTARIERLLVDDDFDDLSQWAIVNSQNRPNRWEVGNLDGESAGYVTASPGANDYLPGSEAALSIAHLYRDIYFPTDSSVGSVRIVLRVLGNGNLAEPTNDAQDFAAFHMIDTSTVPRGDEGVGFEHRLEGQMLTRLENGGDYVIEHLVLRTNVFRGSLAGTTQRLVISFHSGSGLLGLQPMALAVSRVMVTTNVDIPQQPPVTVQPCCNSEKNFNPV